MSSAHPCGGPQKNHLSEIRKCSQFSCADPGIFVRGGPDQSDQKKLWQRFFFVFFLVLSLFYSSQMVNFKEIYLFSRFQRGSNIFQGGGGRVQLFPVGSNCLFPIETHITCDFPRGSRPPVPPLDLHLILCSFFYLHLWCCSYQWYFKTFIASGNYWLVVAKPQLAVVISRYWFLLYLLLVEFTHK